MDKTKEMKSQSKTLNLMLEHPMLSSRELADMQGIGLERFLGNVERLYMMLIPAMIYPQLTSQQRRMYILLKYSPRFAEMSDSWHETFIDPLFSTTKEKS